MVPGASLVSAPERFRAQLGFFGGHVELEPYPLKDQEGRERSLDELLGKGKVALVFFRSADW